MEFLIAFRLAAEAPGEGRAWEPSSGSVDPRGAGFRFGGHGSGGPRAGTGRRTGWKCSDLGACMLGLDIDQDVSVPSPGRVRGPDVDQDGHIQRWSTLGLPVQALGLGGWVRKVGPARIWAGVRQARAGSQITVHVRLQL